MIDIVLFLFTTYIISGIFQAIIISLYEGWNDGCTAPGEGIIYGCIIMAGWPFLWIMLYFDEKDEVKSHDEIIAGLFCLIIIMSIMIIGEVYLCISFGAMFAAYLLCIIGVLIFIVVLYLFLATYESVS